MWCLLPNWTQKCVYVTVTVPDSNTIDVIHGNKPVTIALVTTQLNRRVWSNLAMNKRDRSFNGHMHFQYPFIHRLKQIKIKPQTCWAWHRNLSLRAIEKNHYHSITQQIQLNYLLRHLIAWPSNKNIFHSNRLKSKWIVFDFFLFLLVEYSLFINCYIVHNCSIFRNHTFILLLIAFRLLSACRDWFSFFYSIVFL